ncbi:hypothetical protein DV495_000768 [Geotrichum candidum]|nr:hypothetical protein DV454_004995 [Geotrichum candidum]KAF5135547.1 hypothetical protein DV495_000768 [Geotrichum candidum]KAI8135185.1 hypothetical protein DUD61_001172 [Geotrichum candidum]
MAPIDSHASAASTSFSSNNSSNINFSIAQHENTSITATATATSVPTNNDDDDFGDFVDSSSNSGSPLTGSHPHASSAMLHFVDQLFQKLVPLPYALKKRVLANIATKKFLDGYLATIQVGVMVLEGRYRRLRRDGPCKQSTSGGGMTAPTHHDPECERAAREFVRIWTAEIVPRLRTAGLRPVELTRVPVGVDATTPTPTTTPIAPSPPASTCVVCGLTRDEQPSVYLLPRRMRWEEKSGPGHLTCLRFWAHRDIYGITI